MRILKMLKLSTHPMLGKLFNKLTEEEMSMITQFVTEHQHLDKNTYMEKANRWLLDQPKPKHYSDMWAIITQLED